MGMGGQREVYRQIDTGPYLFEDFSTICRLHVEPKAFLIYK